MFHIIEIHMRTVEIIDHTGAVIESECVMHGRAKDDAD